MITDVSSSKYVDVRILSFSAKFNLRVILKSKKLFNMTFDKPKALEFLKTFYVDVNKLESKSLCFKHRLTYADLYSFRDINQSLYFLTRNTFGNNIKVHFYGSRTIGVATESSDVDVFVEINDNFHSSYQNQNNFEKMNEALQKSPQWNVIHTVTNATVPVIKAMFVPMKISCKYIHLVNLQ